MRQRRLLPWFRGRYRVADALPEPVPPGPPTLAALTRGDGFLGLSWSTPEEAGTRAIRSYVIERRVGEGLWLVLGTVWAGVHQYGDGDVVVGQTYSYRVTAISAAGAGQASQVRSAVARSSGPIGGNVPSFGSWL